MSARSLATSIAISFTSPWDWSAAPNSSRYVAGSSADSVRLEHLVRPGLDAGDNPYHYVIVHVDGPRLWVEVVGVDWGRGFQPYRSARATLSDTARHP